MNLLRPDVYVEDVQPTLQTIPSTANLVGAMVGATRSGVVGEAVMVTSFAEFVENFANGLDTPYMPDSMLPYAVLGFFQNGGNQLYIVRAVSDTAAVAKVTNPTTWTLSAKNVGTWGNGLSLVITKNEAYVEPDEDAGTEGNLIYDVTVRFGTSNFTVEGVTSVSAMVEALKNNNTFKGWFDVDTFSIASGYTLAEGTITLSGGADGVSDLTDGKIASYFDALTVTDEIMVMSVPGHTTAIMNRSIMDFCDAHYIHPILDMPEGSTVAETKAYRQSISANGGALYYPWLTISDPLTDELINVPTCGHVMGVYARMNNTRGIGKVAAGTTATIRGVVGVETALTGSMVDILNPVGVCCITPRTNAGIVIWGARSLNSTDTTLRYNSDVLINYFFRRSLYRGTQYAVFEPNDDLLRKNVAGTCIAFLQTQFNNRVLKGSSPAEAYYVVCDSTNNTDATINEGQLIVDIGYAPNKPAEFVVIRLAHDMQS